MPTCASRWRSAIALDLNARYTYRSFTYKTPASDTILQITGADPYFIPVGGASSELIGYSFENELGPIVTDGSEQSLNVSASLDVALPHDWHGEIYGAYALEDGVVEQTGLLDSTALDEALGNAPPTGGYDPARLGYFSPYGSGEANSPALLAFISRRERDSSLGQVAMLDAQADGTVINLPGGPLKAALGAQFRLERFTPDTVSNSAADLFTSGGTAFQRTVIAGFLELRAPIVGPNNAVPGIQALEASLAGRVEAYNDVGISGDPKFGLLWTPLGGLDIHATYGRSFRAPSLPDVNALQVIAPGILPNAGSQALVLIRYGGNAGLRPGDGDLLDARRRDEAPVRAASRARRHGLRYPLPRPGRHAGAERSRQRPDQSGLRAVRHARRSGRQPGRSRPGRVADRPIGRERRQ